MNTKIQQEEQYEPILRKQIKQEDQEQTQQLWTQEKIKPINNTSIDSKQVNFLSQRERYNYVNNSYGIDYPLPQIFKILWDKFKQIDFNLWKKNSLTLSDIDVLRVRQLMTLDDSLYKTKPVHNSLEIKFTDSLQENLPPYQQNPSTLPAQLQQRQKNVKNLLNNLVQTRHSEYLDLNNISHLFDSQFMRMYHQNFSLEEQEEIKPLKIDDLSPLLSAFTRESLKLTIRKVYELYEKRGVSFMFTENLKQHLKEEAKHLETFVKIIPDIVKQQNQITQINRTLDMQNIIRRIDTMSQ